MTQDDVRRLVAALPGTEERTSYGTPGFRVRDRLFARILEEGSLLVWVPDDFEKQAMVEAEPDKFWTTPHYDGHTSVLVRLDAVDEDELRELLTDSWELRGGTAGGRWTCPRCSREFGRANQGHDCRLGIDVDAVFAGRPPEHGPPTTPWSPTCAPSASCTRTPWASACSSSGSASSPSCDPGSAGCRCPCGAGGTGRRSALPGRPTWTMPWWPA